jgi:uncharacterized protein
MLKILLKPFTLLSCGIAMLASCAQAAQVGKLDEAFVPVASRSLEDKNLGVTQALAQLFVKNAGTEAVLGNESVTRQLQDPHAWLSQFGYLEQEGQLLLRASFDHNRIVSLLRQASLPVWGSQRPLTLVWLVFENDAERMILSDASSLPIRQAFADVESVRGVPVIFPVMDLDELTQISVADVRGMFVDNIAQASSRYQADFFAVASIESVFGSYKFQLSLYPRNGAGSLIQPIYAFQGEAETLPLVSRQMMAALSEFYVTQYAIANSHAQLSTQVTFVQARNMQQLVAIENYLKGLSVVKSAYLSRIQGGKAQFALELFGTEEDFQRLLTLESRISLLGNATDAQGSESQSLSSSQYQWRGR